MAGSVVRVLVGGVLSKEVAPTQRIAGKAVRGDELEFAQLAESMMDSRLSKNAMPWLARTKKEHICGEKVLGRRHICEVAAEGGARFMAREAKLERLAIPPECRTVKDWFPTRESANAAIASIRVHILATGEPHTWSGHTHTKPRRDAVPVYIGEFSLPERLLKAKRFAPCPCCWDEVGKFGHGMIAWFPAESVIRLIGPDCFKGLNPEAHKKARSDYDIEQERMRNTEFLLSNLPKLADTIVTIERAMVVAERIETFHGELHRKLAVSKLKLWPYVRRGGELSVNVKESEFRRGSDGEMYTQEVVASRVEATLPGYQMLDTPLPPLSSSLEAVLKRIRPYNLGDRCRAAAETMDDQEKRTAADTLSRSIKKAKEKIAEIEELRRFTDRVAINTLRRWGAHDGCPIPYYYGHDGQQITFGKSEYQNVAVSLPEGLRNHIGQIDFWTNLQGRRR